MPNSTCMWACSKYDTEVAVCIRARRAAVLFHRAAPLRLCSTLVHLTVPTVSMKGRSTLGLSMTGGRKNGRWLHISWVRQTERVTHRHRLSAYTRNQYRRYTPRRCVRVTFRASISPARRTALLSPRVHPFPWATGRCHQHDPRCALHPQPQPPPHVRTRPCSASDATAGPLPAHTAPRPPTAMHLRSHAIDLQRCDDTYLALISHTPKPTADPAPTRTAPQAPPQGTIYRYPRHRLTRHPPALRPRHHHRAPYTGTHATG